MANFGRLIDAYISNPKARPTILIAAAVALGVLLAYGKGYRDGQPAAISATRPASPPVEAGQIGFGQSAEGDLPQGETLVWSFYGARDTLVTIRLRADWVSQLRLTGPGGVRLGETYVSPGEKSAVICAKRLPQDGTYTVLLNGWGSTPATSFGPYSLTLEQAQTPEQTPETTTTAQGAFVMVRTVSSCR